MPIIRAVEKAREERETQSNDRHLELMNALKSLDDILEELKLHLPNNVRSKRAGKSRQTTTENDIKKQAEGRFINVFKNDMRFPRAGARLGKGIGLIEPMGKLKSR